MPWQFWSSVKIYFGYLLVLYVNVSVKSLKIGPKLYFPYFQPILAASFGTIATIKVKLIPDLCTLAIVLIGLEGIGEKQLVSFGLIVGQNSPLMHVALSPLNRALLLKISKLTRIKMPFDTKSRWADPIHSRTNWQHAYKHFIVVFPIWSTMESV